jgi:hypothetical protein
MKIRPFLFAIPAIALLAQPAHAADSDVDLAYKIYVGGFHVMDLKVGIGFAAKAYDVAANAKTSGMIGRMFPWSMKAYSRGNMSAQAVQPVSAGQQNNWRGKNRYIDLKFTDGIASIERIAPKPETDDRDSVPVALRTGVVDLTSAILAIIRKMDTDQVCKAEMPVFDGRRRYDLIVKPDGQEKLRPSGYTPYVGDTVNCRLSIDKKAGFKKTDKSGWNKGERSARVWMGKAFGDVPPVPVRLTVDTPIGNLIAHLSAATYRNGVKNLRLGAQQASAED